MDHINSGCPILAKNEYLMSHDKICTYLRCLTCKALGTEMTDKWYTHSHTHSNHCMNRKMLQCCGNKQKTQTEKLQQIGHGKKKGGKKKKKHAY